MRDIYRTAWHCVVKNPFLFVVVAGCFLTADFSGLFLAEKRSLRLHLLKPVVWYGFAYVLHRAILLGEDWRGRVVLPNSRKSALGRFLLVSFIMVGSAVILPIILSLVVPATAIPLVGGLRYLLSALIYGLGLMLFGTALPAAAMRDNFGLRLTFIRGRQTWWMVFRGILAGPALFAVFVGAVAFFLDKALGPIPLLYQDGAGFSPAALAWQVVITAMSLFTTLLAVVVLSQAYRKVAPPEIAALLAPEPGRQ